MENINIKLLVKTGESLSDILKRNFSIYRKKNVYSPIYLISNDNEVFEVGYFDDSMNCTYKISDVSIDDILKTENEKYIRIEEIAKVTDFKMGINLVIQDMIKETLK